MFGRPVFGRSAFGQLVFGQSVFDSNCKKKSLAFSFFRRNFLKTVFSFFFSFCSFGSLVQISQFDVFLDLLVFFKILSSENENKKDDVRRSDNIFS